MRSNDWCQAKIQTGYIPNTLDYSIPVNTLRPKQNGCHFPDDIFKWIFLNENEWISIKVSLMFVPKGVINNIPALVQIMAWRRPGDKPLSESMMASFLTHICVTRPQRVKSPRISGRTPEKYEDLSYKLMLIFKSPGNLLLQLDNTATGTQSVTDKFQTAVHSNNLELGKQ